MKILTLSPCWQYDSANKDWQMGKTKVWEYSHGFIQTTV